MKRYIRLKNELSEKTFDDRARSIELTLHYEEVIPLFMELQMLGGGHSDSLTVQSSGKSNLLSIRYGHKVSRVKVEKGKYHIEFGEKEFGFLSSFLLQYYRDSVAPVDHIDMELAYDNEVVYLVIRTADFSN